MSNCSNVTIKGRVNINQVIIDQESFLFYIENS